MVKNTSSKKPTALTEWTYEYLKEEILNLNFKPGEQLHIDEFAEKLEVSRTPIREAFLRLANEGLLDIKPRVGYFVTEITEEDIRDLFEIREMVETRATRKAAELLSDEDLKYLQVVLNESSRAVDNGDLDTYIEKDMKFHGSLEKHIQNKRMVAFLESINNLTYRERILSMRSSENVRLTLIEHQKILDALVERDGKKAEWLMGEHLAKVSQRLISYIRSESSK